MKVVTVTDLKPLKPLTAWETMQFKQLCKYLPFEMTVKEENGP